jgi:hypothetical protein
VLKKSLLKANNPVGLLAHEQNVSIESIGNRSGGGGGSSSSTHIAAMSSFASSGNDECRTDCNMYKYMGSKV